MSTGPLDHLYTHRQWRKRRAWQLNHEPLCRSCKQRGIVRQATVADHITPHRGDSEAFWFGELQSLCKSCHDNQKQMEERRGFSTACDVHGAPIDQRHPSLK